MKILTEKPDIRSLKEDQLKEVLLSWGEKPFRSKQVLEWLWQKSAYTFEEMTNLSKDLRQLLQDQYSLQGLEIHQQQKSKDGTIKSAFKLYDQNIIESVLIPTEDRITACVSSQVGCSLTCSFCATGYMDRVRNLEPFEIYDQVVAIRNQAETHFQQPLTNIVYMGMGEPLLNYANVLKSIERITSPAGLHMSPKRITVSTAGIAKMMHKLADDQVKFNLALSLHAANDDKRNRIMPINESNTLEALSEALVYFDQKTGNRITLEYIVFDQFNDSVEDAEQLALFATKFPAHINIIEYNPIEAAKFKNASIDKIERFQKILERKGHSVTVRRSRGKDIDAACGQLANKQE